MSKEKTWMELEDARALQQILQEQHKLECVRPHSVVLQTDSTKKWEPLPDSNYVCGIDPFERKLNWFQKFLQKFGFYKRGVSKVTIFKKQEDGTIEHLTK